MRSFLLVLLVREVMVKCNERYLILTINPFKNHLALSTAIESVSEINLIANINITSDKGIVVKSNDPIQTLINVVIIMSANSANPNNKGTPQTSDFLANAL